MILFFSELLFRIVIFVVLVLSSCSLVDQVNKSSCSVDLGKRMTIDATDVEAQVIFDQLAQELDCAIAVDPVIRQRLTVKMVNATISEILAVVCGEKEVCKYTYDGTHLSISHLSFLDKLRWRARLCDDQARDEWLKKFSVRLPPGMQYEDATASSVLEEISTVSGLEITPWEGEGDRKVNLDLSGMTVDEGLEAIVRYIDGEGVVMVKIWNGGNGQHRLVDKP
jgi:hypothetical protein